MLRRAPLAGRIAASLLAVGLVTALSATAAHVNPTTIALTYLIVVLLIATTWGIAESTITSLAAVFCLNFFFLPPLGTLTIADPQNWVALVAFLITATVASQLSGRARIRHIEALARQNDLERLYALSRALLLSDEGASHPSTIARHIADAFGLRAVGIYDQRRDVVAWGGPTEFAGGADRLRDVARRGIAMQDPDGAMVVAIHLGGQTVGSIAIADATLSDTVLHSIANLAAIWLERARSVETTARAEASRQSSELRATVLDALAHEFKTPLTSMKAASGELLTSAGIAPRDRELVTILDEELDRFESLVSDAVQMLRIDAGDFAVHVSRHRLRDIVEAMLRRFTHRLEGHRLVVTVPGDLTVDVDGELMSLALRQLLDNALKYSPADSALEVRAEIDVTVGITVWNSGSSIPDSERARVLERFYRGARSRNIPGTGMGLAIVEQIARAHGGTLVVSTSPQEGTAFTFTLPRGAARP